MDNAKILDWNVLSALGLFPEKEEEIIWARQPMISPWVPGTNNGWPNRLLFAFYCGVVLAIKESVSTGQIALALFAFGAVLLFQVLPFAMKYLEIKRSVYVVTNRRIILKLNRYFREKVHILRYDDFQKATFVMEYGGSDFGTLYLMTGKDVGFWTYDIVSGEKRHHPTMECVPGTEKLALEIEKIRAETVSGHLVPLAN